MNNAKCTEDGLIYTALEFSRLISSDLERKRRFLQCQVCSGPAFFRHASPVGRAACFGARPHAHGCQLAAQDNLLDDCAGDNQCAMHIPNSRIIVDFRYGAPAEQDCFYGLGHVPMRENAVRNYGQPHAHIYRRRLGPLLRTLIESPAFSSSDQIVEIEGRGNMAARDLFLPLQCATYQYSGIYRGYFGVISDAKLALDKSLWFNSGGNDNISFCLDSKYVYVILQRYGIKELEDLAGAYILVMGTPRVSQNGKLFCLVEGTEHMALKPT